MKICRNKKYGFIYHYDVLDDGLKVVVVKKPGIHNIHASITASFGSVDNKFIPNDSNEEVNTPYGIAHFLEHVLFDLGDGLDASSIFEGLGAESNAYTTKTETCYYFNTVDNFYDCLRVLMHFVQKPNFSKEKVESERKIIEQEVKMVNDNIDDQINNGLLELMYEENSVRVDIGGTIESIKEITYDDLLLCHKTFYHPSNLTLVVVGDIKPYKLMGEIKKIQKSFEFEKINKPFKVNYINESSKVFKTENTAEKDLFIPKCNIGLKLNLDELDITEKTKIAMSIDLLCEYFFDESGDLYKILDKDDLVNESFYYNTFLRRCASYLEFGIDIKEVDLFRSKFIDLLLSIPNLEITEEKFNRIKRRAYGTMIKSFNSQNFIKEIMLGFMRNKIDPFKYIQTMIDLTIDDVNKVKKYIKKESISTNTFYIKSN